jgi:hypothetical protein
MREDPARKNKERRSHKMRGADFYGVGNSSRLGSFGLAIAETCVSSG